MANVIPLPKINPPMLIEKDIIPISLTPIVTKVLESIIMKLVDDIIDRELDSKQFCGICRTSTTDVLVEIIHISVYFYDMKRLINLIQINLCPCCNAEI